jgi:hypothetical protein
MAKVKLTPEQLKRAKKHLYHHIDCKQMREVSIKLTEKGRAIQKSFALIALSSKDTIGEGLKAVDASPFKTVFVIDDASGAVLFALSKNPQYVAAAKKKDPPDPPDFPPVGECCQLCYNLGGTSCQPLSDGSCICFGATRTPGDISTSDELGTLGD